LRGLGNSILPGNLDHTDFNQVHWVSANDAFAYTRFLFHEHKLFCGATTGANYQVAKWLAVNNPHEKFIFLSADTGERYISTVYNKAWLKKNNLLHQPNIMPNQVNSLSEVNIEWACIDWRRRALEQMVEVVA
jgi:cysteine synthase A